MIDATLDADELLVLARLDIQRGAVGEGLLKLKGALALPEHPIAVLIELARLYAQLGLRRKAEPLFQRYLERAPADVDALFQVGMLQFDEGRREEAWRLWDQVLAASPQYPPAHFYRAVILADAGRADESIALLKNLMVFAQPDNMYVERAKDLIARLSAKKSGAPGTDAASAIAASAYRTSH